MTRPPNLFRRGPASMLQFNIAILRNSVIDICCTYFDSVYQYNPFYIYICIQVQFFDIVLDVYND
jgi:hypothetical protein